MPIPKNNRVTTLFLVLVFIVTLVMFNSIEGTFRDFSRAAFRVFKNPNSFNYNLNTPQAGEEVLPSRVREMLALLRIYKIEAYQVSNEIIMDGWVFQQIVATSWPRKLEGTAKEKFFLISEPIPNNCNLKAKKQEVMLVTCR